MRRAGEYNERAQSDKLEFDAEHNAGVGPASTNTSFIFYYLLGPSTLHPTNSRHEKLLSKRIIIIIDALFSTILGSYTFPFIRMASGQ